MGFFDNLFRTDVTKKGSVEVGGRGLFNLGDTIYTPQYSTTNAQDYSKTISFAPVYSFGSSGVSGATITTKKEQKISTEQTAEPSIEKPFGFSPALIGGGSTQATGEGSASTGLQLIPLIAVGGVVIVGGMILLNKFGKKKKK